MKLEIKRVFASSNSVDCFSCKELIIKESKCMCRFKNDLISIGKWRDCERIAKIHLPCEHFKTMHTWKKI